MMMFSVIGIGLVGVSTSSLRDLSLESRTTLETFELKRGLELLAAELRMSSMLSPYLPGTVESAANCAGALEVTETTVKFFVAVDDGAAINTGGLQPYYVGYRYDAASRQLLRGEIAVSDLFSCNATIGDPTSAAFTRPVASNVAPVDSDNNGVVDSPFTWSAGILSVNLGTSISGPGNRTKQRPFSSRIHGRIL
jgi:hypothetical protein